MLHSELPSPWTYYGIEPCNNLNVALSLSSTVEHGLCCSVGAFEIINDHLTSFLCCMIEDGMPSETPASNMHTCSWNLVFPQCAFVLYGYLDFLYSVCVCVTVKLYMWNCMCQVSKKNAACSSGYTPDEPCVGCTRSWAWDVVSVHTFH